MGWKRRLVKADILWRFLNEACYLTLKWATSTTSTSTYTEGAVPEKDLGRSTGSETDERVASSFNL